MFFPKKRKQANSSIQRPLYKLHRARHVSISCLWFSLLPSFYERSVALLARSMTGILIKPNQNHQLILRRLMMTKTNMKLRMGLLSSRSRGILPS